MRVRPRRDAACLGPQQAATRTTCVFPPLTHALLPLLCCHGARCRPTHPPTHPAPPRAAIAPNVGVPSPANGLWGAPPPAAPSPMGFTLPSRTYALGPLSATTVATPAGMVMAAERGAAEAQVRVCVGGGVVCAGVQGGAWGCVGGCAGVRGGVMGVGGGAHACMPGCPRSCPCHSRCPCCCSCLLTPPTLPTLPTLRAPHRCASRAVPWPLACCPPRPWAACAWWRRCTPPSTPSCTRSRL